MRPYLVVLSSFNRQGSFTPDATNSRYPAISLRTLQTSKAVEIFSTHMGHMTFVVTEWDAYIPYGEHFDPEKTPESNPMFKFMIEANEGTRSASIILGYETKDKYGRTETLIGHVCTNLELIEEKLTSFKALKTYTETR